MTPRVQRAAAVVAAAACGIAIGPRLVDAAASPALCIMAIAAITAVTVPLWRWALAHLVAPQMLGRSRLQAATRLGLVALAAAALLPVVDESAPRIDWQFVDRSGDRGPALERRHSAWGETRNAIRLHARVDERPDWNWSVRSALPERGAVVDLWLTQPPQSVLRPDGEPQRDADGVVVEVFALDAQQVEHKIARWHQDLGRDAEARRWHRLRIELPDAPPALRIDVLPGAAGNPHHDHLLLGATLVRGWTATAVRVATWAAIALLLLCFGWFVDSRIQVPEARSAAERVPLDRRRFGRGLLVVGVAVALAAGSTIAFVTAERTVYIFDATVYWDQVRWLLQCWERGPAFAWDHLRWSLGHADYNALAAVPLAAVAKLLGPSRLAYELSIVVVYFTAFVAMLLAVGRSVALRGGTAPQGWSDVAMVGAAVVFPFTLAPILQGYVDCGAAAIALAILAIYCRRPLPASSGRSLVAIGVLIATMVLFRRYFAYWAVSFFVLMTVDASCHLLASRTWRGGELRRLLRPLIVPGVVALLVMLAAAAPKVIAMLTTNYADAYAAYKFTHSSAEELQQLVVTFGWGPLALVAACWIATLCWRSTRRLAGLLLLQVVVIHWLFTRVQDFGLHHWYLMQPSVLTIVGLAAARTIVAVKARAGRIGLATAFVLAGVIVSTAVLVPHAETLRSSLEMLVPTRRVHPQVRDDLDALRRLQLALDARLREAGADAKLYVLSGSTTLTSDHIRQGDVALGVSTVNASRMLRPRYVDLRDGFPIGLLEAEIIVTTDPPTKNWGQKTVLLPARSLLAGQGFGAAFERLPDEFQLDDGYRAVIFRKRRPIEASEVAALSAALRAEYPDHPFVYDPGSAAVR